MLARAILLCLALAVPPPPDTFPGLDRQRPTYPGGRAIRFEVQPATGEPSADLEAWVVYGEDRAQVETATIGGGVSHGRARHLATIGNERAEYQFIFPHSDHTAPNVQDANPRVLPQGRTVFYRVVTRRGADSTASALVEFVMPARLTIANFGDSYSSGEGAPYQTGEKWDDARCHRCDNSGQMRAIRQLRVDQPEVALDWTNVACSGAEVEDGLLTSQRLTGFLQDDTLAERVRPQLDQVEEWLRAGDYERLNVALISIGGNDIGFGPFVKRYFILAHDISDPDNAQARENIRLDIDQRIPLHYDMLRTGLDAKFDYDRVLVTEYPDPTHDVEGDFCGARWPWNYGTCWGPVELTSGEAEYSFACESIVRRLNRTIREKVESYTNWRFVSGAMERSERHGLCDCTEPFFNTIGASFAYQRDLQGTMHLNRRGHEYIYKPIVLDALEAAVRDLRRETLPRALESPPRAMQFGDRNPRRAAAVARLAGPRVLRESQFLRSAPPAPITPELQAKIAESARGVTDDGGPDVPRERRPRE